MYSTNYPRSGSTYIFSTNEYIFKPEISSFKSSILRSKYGVLLLLSVTPEVIYNKKTINQFKIFFEICKYNFNWSLQADSISKYAKSFRKSERYDCLFSLKVKHTETQFKTPPNRDIHTNRNQSSTVLFAYLSISIRVLSPQ